MTEQQQHLQQLIFQQDDLIRDLQTINTNATSKREILLKVQGAIEYLTQIGVTLPEPEPEVLQEEQTEAPAE